MADTALQVVVSPFLGVFYEKLSSLIGREFDLLRGVNKDCLETILSTIRLVLRDAEAIQIRDETTRDWLRQLKDVAYDADDVLDEWAYESLMLESDVGDRSCNEQVSASISTCFDLKQLIIRRKIGKRIKKILERFGAIAALRNSFHLSPGDRPRAGVEESSQSNRKTSSILIEPIVYGRDEDKEKIVWILQNNLSNQYSLSICPILGIGGIGKTTLAQLVYHDEWVEKQFGTRIWVCVSDDFCVERLTKAIIQFLTGQPCVLTELDPMQNRLRELLKGNKFLLVLDDVWSADVEKWDRLKRLLACGEKGSSIIVTTRLQLVVESLSHHRVIIDSITCTINPTIPLSSLSEDFCLSLFKYHAFGTENEENPTLVKIGKEIVHKCGGVPFAVKALGALLRSQSEAMWIDVSKSELCALGEHGEETIFPTLKLSYNHLPSYLNLKQCFAYCSIFPKDHEIEREELIRLWIANDFVQIGGGMELEEIGDKIFNELLRRSFFHDIREDKDGTIKECKMHDLMHDLASLVMKNERHVSLLEPDRRTFFAFTETSTSNQLPSNFQQFKRLRVLNLSRHKDVQALLDSIGHLKHLRYLNLCNTGIKSLPKSFSCLRNLQNLDLSENPEITTLPVSIGSLEQLRYLNLSNFYPRGRIASLPESLSRLQNLRVLNLRGNPKITALPPSIGNLGKLRYLNLSRTQILFLPESIGGLTNLQILYLSWNDKFLTLPNSIGNLEQLRHLNLSHTSISSLPETIESLKNLRNLNLFYCPKLKTLPESICRLKSLRTLDLSKLSHMPVGIGQLTCLQSLDAFIVGPGGEGAGIQELGGLNQIKGRLWIWGLEHVRNPEDAESADLKSKKDISELWLQWKYHGDNKVDSRRLSEMVLEGLQPHPNVESLRLIGYPGVTFPSWMGDSSALPNLTRLELWNMPNLEGWSSALKLTSLLHLEIKRCPELEISAVEFQHLISLTELELTSLPKLTSLPEGLQHVTTLKWLNIRDCKNLKVLPEWMQNLSALETFNIRQCHPELHERCEKDKGRDWHKISHIGDFYNF